MSFEEEYPERYEETKESIKSFLEGHKGVEFRTAQLTDLSGFVAGNMQVHEVLEDLAQETPIHEVENATWVWTDGGTLDDF